MIDEPQAILEFEEKYPYTITAKKGDRVVVSLDDDTYLCELVYKRKKQGKAVMKYKLAVVNKTISN